MAHTFLAYIDESGDDGIGHFREPGARGGASNWLVISALVFRYTYGLDAVQWRDAIKQQMPEKRGRGLHFTNLNHGQKLVAVRHVARLPVKAINIVGFKRQIPDGIFNEKNQLYFYLTRYLIERISWLCRDMRPMTPEGDGRVKIVFSRRGGMSYEDFRTYLHRLKANTGGDIRIHWPVIDIDGVDAKDHPSNAGLQLVDTVASAFANGIEPDRYANCEARYSEILKPIVYNRSRNYFSYGVKFYPRHEDIQLTEDQARFVNLFK